MSLSDSTITGNTADGSGGGIFNNPSGTLAVSDSTISGNTAGVDGGGIDVSSGTVTLQDTTVSGNVPDNCAPPGSVTGCTG